LSPDALGKPLFYIEQIQASEDGLEVVYCLYQLEGAAYRLPDDTIEDSTEYVKIGFIIGNASGTAFITQPKGGYDFILDGNEYMNVTIYTKSEAIARISDEEEQDPTGPQKPEPESTPPTRDPDNLQPDYGLGLGGGRRYGGIA